LVKIKTNFVLAATFDDLSDSEDLIFLKALFDLAKKFPFKLFVTQIFVKNLARECCQ
jgi:hypothetical protein